VSAFVRRWRRSILLQVTSLSIAISLIVIATVGTVLYTKIAAGVYHEKNSAAIAEAQSLADYTQAQLDATRYRTDISLKTVIDNIFRASQVSPTTSVRETIMLATPATAKISKQYQGSSNDVLLSTIPNSLRISVRKNFYSQSMRVQIRYAKNSRAPIDAIAVGRVLGIPSSAIYEIYYLFPLTQQSQLIDLIRGWMLGTGAALVILIALITWYVIRRVVLPVREVAQIAEQLTEGDLSRRLLIRGEDEMGRLAISFNEMALSMQQQISRLENLSRLQQRFVSDVSHELRTPLTTIRMASQLLYESRSRLDPAASRSAELLVSQIERFESLLSDLLEVSRFDARAAILETKDIDLKPLVLNVIDQLQANQLPHFSFIAPDNEYRALVDDRRIERIIRNLLSNAMDHSEGRGVVVSIAQSEHVIAIAVRDYGIGFNEREADRLFDRFWRADPSRSRVRGGTGLGLAIALDDAKLHQGTLKAWGRPGHGANFVLTLPKSPGIPIDSEPIDVIPSDQPPTILADFDIDDI
jgi:two-component system, OmpR family, sensor histidine kinase MtrB